MKASGHAGLAVCSCCGSVRLFGHEVNVSVCAACWLGSVYVCNRHLTTQTQQAANKKRQWRRSAVLTARSLSSLLCDNLLNVGENILGGGSGGREMDEQRERETWASVLLKSVRGADSCCLYLFPDEKRESEIGCVQGLREILIHHLVSWSRDRWGERKQHYGVCLHRSGGLI